MNILSRLLVGSVCVAAMGAMVFSDTVKATFDAPAPLDRTEMALTSLDDTPVAMAIDAEVSTVPAMPYCGGRCEAWVLLSPRLR